MNRKSVFSFSGTGGYTQLLILSAILSALLVFSGVRVGWAKAPKTEKIAFVSKRDGNAEIYIMNPDGTEQVNLTQHPAEDYDPAWAPDGKQILFSSDRTGDTFDLYLMDTDGKNVQKVFKNNEYRRNPAWSPDGKRIAYAQADRRKAILAHGARFAATAEHTLYIATPNGTSIEKLTKGLRPSWSPDGRKLIFVIAGLDHTPLGVFDLATRTLNVLLPKELPWTTSPVWSPQGDKIAFSKLNGAGFNERGGLRFRNAALYIANRNGAGLQQVTDERVAFGPTWSPQGNQIIYNDIGELFLQLYKIDIKGGNPTQLTTEGNNSSPDWFNPNAFMISPSARSVTTTWGQLKQH
ncbi:hypothetical protein C6496_07060 [Candidatus Poribacteria bacterium]|nr:MAG: hypothetical protein C6496_07060 [Candidatus Poribacteria bacterium]